MERCPLGKNDPGGRFIEVDVIVKFKSENSAQWLANVR